MKRLTKTVLLTAIITLLVGCVAFNFSLPKLDPSYKKVDQISRNDLVGKWKVEKATMTDFAYDYDFRFAGAFKRGYEEYLIFSLDGSYEEWLYENGAFIGRGVSNYNLSGNTIVINFPNPRSDLGQSYRVIYTVRVKTKKEIVLEQKALGLNVLTRTYLRKVED